MSQENVKTVLDAIAAFNRGGPDAWSEFFTDDMSTTGQSRAASMILAPSETGTPCATTPRTGSTPSTTSGSKLPS